MAPWCRRSPGADPEIYFASDEHDRRLTSLHGEINDMIYGSHEAPNAKCTLSVSGCPPDCFPRCNRACAVPDDSDAGKRPLALLSKWGLA